MHLKIYDKSANIHKFFGERTEFIDYRVNKHSLTHWIFLPETYIYNIVLIIRNDLICFIELYHQISEATM